MTLSGNETIEGLGKGNDAVEDLPYFFIQALHPTVPIGGRGDLPAVLQNKDQFIGVQLRKFRYIHLRGWKEIFGRISSIQAGMITALRLRAGFLEIGNVFDLKEPEQVLCR